MSPVSLFSDEELLQRLASGDAAALETVIRCNYAVLCRFAEKFLPDASLAQDVVQESFVKLWKSGKTFESLGAMKAYLYAITRNGCLDVIRSRDRLSSRHRQATLLDDQAIEPVLTEIVRAESMALIYEAVHAMPENLQQVFLLSYRDGMTVSEISAHLGIKLKTVKKRKYTLLVALRGRFGNRSHLFLGALSAIEIMGQGRL